MGQPILEMQPLLVEKLLTGMQTTQVLQLLLHLRVQILELILPGLRPEI